MGSKKSVVGADHHACELWCGGVVEIVLARDAGVDGEKKAGVVRSKRASDKGGGGATTAGPGE